MAVKKTVKKAAAKKPATKKVAVKTVSYTHLTLPTNREV